MIRYRGECWAGVDDAGWSSSVCSGTFADGESRVSIDFGDGVGPKCALAWLEWSGLKRRCCLWVGGIVGLLVESSLQEAGGDGGLAWASVLTAPEASELGSLYCITWHGKLEEVSTGEDCSGEGRSESKDLSSPFEDLLVHSLQLERRRGDELAGVCEPRNEDAL